jgi:hypothetical protein
MDLQADEAFRAKFQGEIITPESAGYISAIERWSKLSEKRASMVVCPTCEEDVVAAVKHAVASNLAIAIKCELALEP